MKKRKQVIALACLSALLSGSGTAVYALSSVSVENHASVGIVDIQLTEYHLVDGKEEPWADNPLILPGTRISKIPRISNSGNDCYVRVKFEAKEGEAGIEQGIYGIQKDWKQKEDGYYYYTKVLKTGENVDLFQGLVIPENLPQEEYEGCEIGLEICAEAIQSRNFSPDFQGETPWGNVEILSCEKKGDYDISSFQKADQKRFEIVYLGESKKMAANEKDFFANFPVWMPGDTCKDSIRFVNDSQNRQEIYFRSESLENPELLEKIHLSITCEMDGTTEKIYEGPLEAKGLSEGKVLCRIPEHGEGKLNFSIEVPPELDNPSALEESSLRWIYSTEPISEKTADAGSPDGKNRKETVKTGDYQKFGDLLWAVGLSAAMAAILIGRKLSFHKSREVSNERKK